MSSQGRKDQRFDPTKHTPNVLVDEIVYGQTNYEQFDTRPLPPDTGPTVTVFQDVGIGRVVTRTANIIVDQILDGKLPMHAPKPKEPYVYTGRQQQQKKSGKVTSNYEEGEPTEDVHTHVQMQTTVIRHTENIEDEIFVRGTGEVSKHLQEGERGAATKHNPNSLVDDMFGGPQRGRPLARTTATTVREEQGSRFASKSTKKLQEPSPNKSSDRSQINLSTSLKYASLFFRLVLKKKELTTGGQVFSRLLLQSQKGSQIKSRVASLASTFNHLRNRKIAQGFSSILTTSYKKATIITIEPSSPRDNNREQTSSTTRLPRTSRNRLDVRERSAASLHVDEQKEEEKKMMALSEEAKQAIMNFQRFDRYIFPFESEKHLKVPIENELRRLQKIKSANKSMWNTYYDNELIITCLYNHMKNLYELNRDLEKIDLLKVQNEKLEKRIIETNIQKKKEIDEARSRNPVSQGQQNTLLKEYQKSTEFLTSTLNETNEKARKLLENQLKKAASPHRELLEVTLDMVNELIQFQEATNESVAIQGFLMKLIEEQADSTRTIQNLQRQRKTFEKSVSEAKTDEARNMNNSLLSVCSYLINLHSKLRTLKGQGSARFDDPKDLNKLKADLETERNRIRDLEAKIQQLNKQKRALEDMKDITVLTTWETELTQIIEKSENKEAYQSDIGKQRKLLTMRKDNKYNSIITLNLNLLDSMLKKDRELEKLERQLQERPNAPGPTKLLEEKFNKERVRAQTAEAEIERLNEQLESLLRKEKLREKEKDPLQAELLDLFKICTILEQVLATREAEAGTSTGTNSTTVEMQKARKSLEKSKKESTNIQPIVSMMENLLRILLDLETNERNRQKEEEKFELQRTKELNGIDTFTKIFMRLVEADNLKVDDGLINRLRKNLDITRGKLDKGAADSPVSDLYDMYRNVVEMQARLIELMEVALKSAKEESAISGAQRLPIQSVDRKQKDQEETQLKRIQQLEKQLEIEKGRFATRDAEMSRLKEAEESLSRKLQHLQKQLQTEKNRLVMREQELASKEEDLKKLRTDIQVKQQELKATRGELTSRDQELKKTTAEFNKKADMDNQVRNLKESIQKYVETERNLNRRIGELERAEAESKRQTTEQQRQIAELTKQVGQLQKQYNDSAREAAETQKLNIDANRQLAELHKQVGENSKLSTDGRSKVKELSDQISELNRMLKEATNSNLSLTEQNRNLNDQNKQLGGELKELNGQVRDLNNQVRELSNQIRELNNRETESQRTIIQLRSRQQQSANKSNQQSQQFVDRLQKDKDRLDVAVADLNRQLGELSAKQSTSSQQLRNITRDLENANKNLKQKSDELANEQREAQRLRDELNRTREDTGRKGDDTQRLQNENRVQNMELTRLREELSKSTIELARLRDDNGRTANELSRLRDELARVNSELNRSRDEASRIKTDRSQSSSEAVQLRNTILILERKIGGLESNLNQIKFLEEANKSLKDQNDVLRQQLLLRSKSVQPQQPTNTVDNNRLTAEVARLQQEYNKLKSESDRTLSQKQTEFGIIEAEVKRLNVIVNSNEGQFNALVRDNEVLLHDNQVFFNDINAYKQKEGDLQKIIQELEAKLGGKSSEAASTATLRMEFNTKEARYLEEIRVLKQDKTTLERDLLGRQSSQQMLKSLSERETKLRSEKSDLERQLISRNNEISELKLKLSQASSQHLQSSTSEVNRMRVEFSTKEETLKRNIRDLEIREADLKRLVDSNSLMYNQNEQRLNSELNSLKLQLANRTSSTAELERLKYTHVEKSVFEQKDRQLTSTQRELRDANATINRLQAEKRAFDEAFAKKQKDYDVIMLELNTRAKLDSHQSSRTDELERANQRIQRQLVEVEARFEQQSRELERARTSSTPISPTEITSPNSRYMLLMEEKKSIELEHFKLKTVFEKESNFRRELEEKFAAILQEKTRFLEKIDGLQRTVHAKELDLLKNYEAREENLKDLINENKKLQRELKIINDKLSAEHKISLKSLEENLAKMESDLSKLRRENATLKDEIEDLEDELADRSRNITPNRQSSRLQRPAYPGDDDTDDRYLLKVDGERMREEIYYLECSNEKLKQKIRNLEDQSVHSVRSGGDSYRRISQSRVLGDDRANNMNDKLNEKVKYLERERHTLYQRLKILSVFSHIDQDNHAFVHNLNRVLDNILQFLNDSEQFSESFITYGNFISNISESVSSDNYERYFQNVEDFLKDLFLRTFESKNQILAKQAGQLIHFREQMSELVNEQIDYIEEEERVAPRSTYSRHNDFDRPHYSEPAGMASFIALQHLFRLYVRAKSPEVLEEIAQLLNINELGLEGLVV